MIELSVMPDFTIFIQMFQFILITFIVSRFIVAPIKKNMDKRDTKIEMMGSNAKESFEEMERKKLEYESQLSAVNKELSEYRAQLTKEASDRAQGIIDKVEKEINDETESVREKIREEARTARDELNTKVSDFSKQIIDTISN